MTTLTGTLTPDAPLPVTPASHSLRKGVFATLWQFVAHLTCRHKDAIPKFGGKRIRLECPDCGMSSPGWELGK